MTSNYLKTVVEHRKFHVEVIEHWSKADTILNDWGIWRRNSVDAGVQDSEDMDKVDSLEIGQSTTSTIGGGFPGEVFDWVKVTRVSDYTPIPDTRSWFDKLIHFVFRVDYTPG